MKVLCKLPNAAEIISGVKFTAREDGGKISEEISAEKAEAFTSIPGYELMQDKPKKYAATKRDAAVTQEVKGDASGAVVPDADETVF